MTAPSMAAHRPLSSVYASRLRVSRLHDDGSLDPGSENQYVSDAIVSIGQTPNVQAGEEFTQRNGGGGICVYVTEQDSIVRYDLTLSLCQLDAELIEILTGGRVLSVGGTTVGFAVPALDAIAPSVLVEAWGEARDGSAQASEDGAALYWHHVWTNVQWTLGAFTLERGILTVPLTGKAVENPSMGLGPGGEWPEVITEAYAFFLDDEIPAATDGYQSLVVAGSAS
jgi:hypothetical protein